MDGFTKEWLNEYRRKIITTGCATVPAPHMEPPTRVSSVAKKKNPRLDSQSRLHLHVKSYRHRLADADGISAKAVVDGFIHAHLLATDSPEVVKEVSYEQNKIGKEEIEHTIIEIYEALDPVPLGDVARGINNK